MKAIISRGYYKNETLGYMMIIDGERPVFSCKTIELPDLGNQQNISCIPEGKYEVHKIVSPTRGTCFHVQDVPGRTAILIHPGNYVAGGKRDSMGCILPGAGFEDINNDGFIDVFDSRRTMDKLLEFLPDKFNLTIT